MELSAKWRKKHRLEGDGVDVEDDSEPIDYQEQEEMVRSFEMEHDRQNRLWRRVFAGFIVGYIAFLVYSTLQQAWFPWELRYHAYFMDEMQSWMVISADLVAVLACSFAVKGIIDSSRSLQHWMWYSCYVGMLLAIFWLFYMLKLPKFRWDVLWLPLGPLSGAGACLYVDRLLHGSLKDVKLLRSYMYNYKAL
ncbi:uncharacterized protein LOC121979223 [Zingiber officinale]|uniref:uncharacterized protein LOC121979223 n=1 Tax=Zingiber officinale TaxID=94328 RepID=UPI001C4CEE85|nr:uncharacterized protein LOC121979223 [Zingiber officinale]XP_042387110.1 uncharacterized protein LOC121979223 [Zingiber officinale]XP_042387111.1 uncharacterized protein LOC121979223 [Zingiber officinale]